MSSQLVNVNGKYVYFFNTVDEALSEASLYDDYVVYQYQDLNLFVIGEIDAHYKKRPHFYDWNGYLYPYSRIDGAGIIQWRLDFINSISVYKKEVLAA